MKKFILLMIISVFTAHFAVAACPLGIAGGGRGTQTTITGDIASETVVDSI